MYPDQPQYSGFLGRRWRDGEKKRGRAREKEKEGKEIGRNMEIKGEKKEVRGKKRGIESDQRDRGGGGGREGEIVRGNER